jgi:glycerophosphoryl diester phosphodiesterase
MARCASSLKTCVMSSTGTVVVAVAAILGLAGVPRSTAAGPPVGVDTTAHRGAAAMAPENTHAGFDYARHTRAEFIEIDVQLSADRVPVLVHDATLARTTNAIEVFPGRESYRVGEFTWAELQQLDAGSWYHPDFARERIPRLEEVIVHARSGAGINIELKDPADSPGVEQVVADVLAADDRWHALNRRGGLVVSSFDLESLASFHALRPDVPVSGIGPVPSDDAALASYAIWMDSWATNYRTMDPADVVRVQAAGLRLIVYTVNSVEHMRQMIDLGVDGIVTDAPQVLQRVKFGFEPLPDARGLVVDHVLADAPGSDITFDAGEYVALRYTTDRPIDVDGWFLLDAVANRLDLGPGYVIPPGGTLQVHTGGGNNAENRYFNDFGRNVLNNDGDSVAVFTPERRLVELHAYYPCTVGKPCPASSP